MNKLDFEAIGENINLIGIDGIITGYADSEDAFVVTGVPAEWQERFRSHGFRDYACYVDYWVDNLVCSSTECGAYEMLKPEDCAEAAELTALCRGQSRGFEGETKEWFIEWVRGTEAGQIASKCSNPAVLIHRTDGRISGISCTAIYAHGSAKGAIAWVRELAVRPDFRGKGIGQTLLAQTLCYGAEHGAKRAFLHVDKLNASALHIYARAGFLPRVGEEQLDMIWEPNARP